MIGPLLLAFLACMTIASLGLFALIRTGVIDQHMSLILFVAAVPLAAWIALGVDAADPGMSPPPQPSQDAPPPVARVDISRLWLPDFDERQPPRRRLRPPAEHDSPVEPPERSVR